MGSASMLAQPEGLGTGWCRTSVGLSYELASASVAAALPLCAFWLHACTRRLRPGGARILAAAPVVAANLMLCRLFCGGRSQWEDANTAVLVAFNVGWLASFKAISWALNRGALCALPLTRAQFLAVFALPITPKVSEEGGAPAGSGPGSSATASRSVTPAGGSSTSLASGWAGGFAPAESATATAAARGKAGGAGSGDGGVGPGMHRSRSGGRLADDAGGSRAMARSWAGKNVMLLAVLGALRWELPALAEALCYGLGLYVLLSFIMDVPAALVIAATRLRVSPHFDHPWASASVASFWSRRWDLAAGNTLRQLIFDPIMDGSLLAPPPGRAAPHPGPARQVLGTAAAFAVSGLVHEAVFWYLTGHTSGGIWFLFFFIQAPIIIAERLALYALRRRGVAAPLWARIAATWTLVLGTGAHLFFPPPIQSGIVGAVVASTRGGTAAVLDGLERLLGLRLVALG